MTDSERGKCTPLLTDFGWVFVREADFPKLTDEAKQRVSRIVKQWWETGHRVHGWTVKVPQ